MESGRRAVRRPRRDVRSAGLPVRRLRGSRPSVPGPGRGRRTASGSSQRGLPRKDLRAAPRGARIPKRPNGLAMIGPGLFAGDFAVPARVMEARPRPGHRAARHGAEGAGLGDGPEYTWMMINMTKRMNVTS